MGFCRKCIEAKVMSAGCVDIQDTGMRSVVYAGPVTGEQIVHGTVAACKADSQGVLQPRQNTAPPTTPTRP